MDKSNDHLEYRCPKLGSQIDFGYCRTVGNDSTPCHRIATCWWEIFDIVGYLQKNLSESAFSTLINTPPETKIMSILERIQEAQNRSRKKPI